MWNPRARRRAEFLLRYAPLLPGAHRNLYQESREAPLIAGNDGDRPRGNETGPVMDASKAAPERAPGMDLPLAGPVRGTGGGNVAWSGDAGSGTRSSPDTRPGMARASAAPPPRTGDWAVCCSGGGIRSATYSLGGLQALEEGGLLGRSKWIVGVSGGSYIAASRALVARGLAEGVRSSPTAPRSTAVTPRGPVFPLPRPAERAALAAGPRCRSARPAVPRAASNSPRAGPTRSSPMPAAASRG